MLPASELAVRVSTAANTTRVLFIASEILGMRSTGGRSLPPTTWLEYKIQPRYRTWLEYKIQPRYRRVCAEGTGDDIAGGRIGDHLLGPDLILKRGLDVGVDEELHAGCNARSSGMEGREEARAIHAIQTVGGGVDGIPAQAGHHPGQRHVVGFNEATAKVHGLAGRKTIPRCVEHQVLVVAVHIRAEQVEGAVVEGGVGANAVEGLTGGQDGGPGVEPLHGTAVEAERAQFHIGVVVWPGCARCLNPLAALRIPLQIDPV